MDRAEDRAVIGEPLYQDVIAGLAEGWQDYAALRRPR